MSAEADRTSLRTVAMMRKSRGGLALLLFVIGCDPGFVMRVTRPVSPRIDRACAADALRADTSFRMLDTVARPALREDSLAIGSFRWWIEGAKYAEVGELGQRQGAGADTLIATWGRVGVASSDGIRRAQNELTTRVDALAEQCSRPQAASRCEFRVTGKQASRCSS